MFMMSTTLLWEMLKSESGWVTILCIVTLEFKTNIFTRKIILLLTFSMDMMPKLSKGKCSLKVMKSIKSNLIINDQLSSYFN